MTYADLWSTPEDRIRYEIIDGAFVVSRAPFLVHQQLTGRLIVMVHAHLVQEQLGDDLYPARIDVRLSEYDIVYPDLVYVSPASRNILDDPALIDGSPDLIVEILSPSSRAFDEKIKYRLYERARVREYWLVNAEQESLSLFTLRDGAYVVPASTDARRIESQVLPGLIIDVPALFVNLR
jgi:Uma2 family endonuclease